MPRSTSRDDRLIVNMTVWRSPDALADYVFRPAHAEVMRRRRAWFAPMREAYQAMWWLPAGELPTVADAELQLAHLREHGPTEYAFTFRAPFASLTSEAAPTDQGWFCRA